MPAAAAALRRIENWPAPSAVSTMFFADAALPKVSNNANAIAGKCLITMFPYRDVPTLLLSVYLMPNDGLQSISLYRHHIHADMLVHDAFPVRDNTKSALSHELILLPSRQIASGRSSGRSGAPNILVECGYSTEYRGLATIRLPHRLCLLMLNNTHLDRSMNGPVRSNFRSQHTIHTLGPPNSHHPPGRICPNCRPPRCA